MVEVWKTGVRYHLVHALALLGVAVAGEGIGWRRVVAGLFVAGMVLFSGSLYLLTLSGTRWLGASRSRCATAVRQVRSRPRDRTPLVRS